MSKAARPAPPAMAVHMMRTDDAGGRRLQTGFSYLWVLLLVALMGVGLSSVAQVESVVIQRDKEQELLAIGRQFRTALERYYKLPISAGIQRYPGSLDDLLLDSRVPGVKRHLRKIFVDPMTAKAEWGLIKIGGRIVGVHSLSTKKPIKQGGFTDDMDFAGKKTYAEWTFVHVAEAAAVGAADAVAGPTPATPPNAGALPP